MHQEASLIELASFSPPLIQVFTASLPVTFIIHFSISNLTLPLWVSLFEWYFYKILSLFTLNMFYSVNFNFLHLKELSLLLELFNSPSIETTRREAVLIDFHTDPSKRFSELQIVPPHSFLLDLYDQYSLTQIS